MPGDGQCKWWIDTGRGGGKAAQVWEECNKGGQRQACDPGFPVELHKLDGYFALGRWHHRVRCQNTGAWLCDLAGEYHKRSFQLLAGIPRRESHQCVEKDASLLYECYTG